MKLTSCSLIASSTVARNVQGTRYHRESCYGPGKCITARFLIGACNFTNRTDSFTVSVREVRSENSSQQQLVEASSSSSNSSSSSSSNRSVAAVTVTVTATVAAVAAAVAVVGLEFLWTNRG
ncbi:hypothetical protein V1477_006981 [Vespula maculifrons]|uniref:Uncharacterized protein n=1 Tax=Vespula maculifrons TaxID=7453 RepID=A0ABD2CHS9_VESMC